MKCEIERKEKKVKGNKCICMDLLLFDGKKWCRYKLDLTKIPGGHQSCFTSWWHTLTRQDSSPQLLSLFFFLMD